MPSSSSSSTSSSAVIATPKSTALLLAAGCKVQIHGLQSVEGQVLNGQVGVVDHYSYHRERHAVSLPGAMDLKMIKEGNLTILEAPPPSTTGSDTTTTTTTTAAVFEDEDQMIENMKLMGMPEKMLKGLTAHQKKTMMEMSKRQDILQRARILANIDAPETKFQYSSDRSYQWRDGNDHIEIRIPCDSSSTTKDEVTCEISDRFLSVSIQGKSVLTGTLFQNILPMVCKWDIVESSKDDTPKTEAEEEIVAASVVVVAIKLQKVKAMRWLMLLR